MIQFTRKQYLELYRDGAPVIAQGRNSNRHTTIVEAAEHATEHAAEINSVGTYEIRIGSEVYYTVKVNAVIYQSEADPYVPPADQAELALDASSYSNVDESVIQFTILRTVDTTERVSVDWAITNVSVTPSSGTVILEIGSAQEIVSVTAGDIAPSETGQLSIFNAQNLSGGVEPAIVAPSSATFTVTNDDVTIYFIPTISLTVGQNQDMTQYILDELNQRTSSRIIGIDTNIMTYDDTPFSESLTAVDVGNMTGLQLEVTY